MSYEGEMLAELRMPSKADVEIHILKALLRHQGVLKEFVRDAAIVDEVATEFGLDEQQRTATLKRIYRKENRTVESPVWLRLLFRATDSLAKLGFVSRPSATLQVYGRREWMLTEKGFDEALRLEARSISKENLGVRTFEVQKEVKKIVSVQRPTIYDPIETSKKIVSRSASSFLRGRGFRQAVIDAYDNSCSFCGFKLASPDNLRWEVEAAHIVPNSSQGKDDVWNGVALCGIHHWAFDVGWLTLDPSFVIQVSNRVRSLSSEVGKIGDVDLLRMFDSNNQTIRLPLDQNLFPHESAIAWHRQNRFVP